MPDRIIPIDDDEQLLPDLDDLLDDADVLSETNGRLRERLGDDFPGAPSDTISTRVPVVDVYGFYLPWHKFDEDKWEYTYLPKALFLWGNISTPG